MTKRGPDRNVQEKEASRSPGGGPLRHVVPRPPREVAGSPGAARALTQRQAAGGAHGRAEAVHLRVPLAVRLPHHPALQDLVLPGLQFLGHGCGGGCAGTGTAEAGYSAEDQTRAAGQTTAAARRSGKDTRRAPPRGPAPSGSAPQAPPLPRVTLGGRRAQASETWTEAGGAGRAAQAWAPRCHLELAGVKAAPGTGSPRPPARTGVHSL